MMSHFCKYPRSTLTKITKKTYQVKRQSARQVSNSLDSKCGENADVKVHELIMEWSHYFRTISQDGGIEI